MIGNEGAKHLIKGVWPNVKKLSISKSFIMQKTIALNLMVIFQWSRMPGTNSKCFKYSSINQITINLMIIFQ